MRGNCSWSFCYSQWSQLLAIVDEANLLLLLTVQRKTGERNSCLCCTAEERAAGEAGHFHCYSQLKMALLEYKVTVKSCCWKILQCCSCSRLKIGHCMLLLLLERWLPWLGSCWFSTLPEEVFLLWNRKRDGEGSWCFWLESKIQGCCFWFWESLGFQCSVAYQFILPSFFLYFLDYSRNFSSFLDYLRMFSFLLEISRVFTYLSKKN